MANPKRKRRWYQFSLKTLLVVMTVSCVAFAWIGVRLHRARDNRARVIGAEKEIKAAVAAIEELDGYVESEHAKKRQQTWLERQFDDPGGPDDPVVVLEVTKVRFRANMGDYLSGVSFHMDATAGLEQLNGLTDLQTLDLAGTEVTDAGLRRVKAMTNLSSLNLAFTKVTDAGLKDIRDLTRLTNLALHHTDVTDAGLKHLKGLTNLKSLDLEETNVTDEGVKKLQQALPRCKIEHHPRGPPLFQQ